MIGEALLPVFAFIAFLVIASVVSSTALFLAACIVAHRFTRDERAARRLAEKPGKHRAGRPLTYPVPLVPRTLASGVVVYGPRTAYGPLLADELLAELDAETWPDDTAVAQWLGGAR